MKSEPLMNTSINRRYFLQQLAASSAAVLTLPHFDKVGQPKYKMGLQLFTIRDAMKLDLNGTLKKVSAIGYQDTETYGFDPEKVSYYGLQASDFKQLLESHQLTTTSGHYNFYEFLNRSKDDVKRYVDQCIKGATAVGHRYITWPWLDPDHRTMADFKVLVNQLNFIGERVTNAGLGFAYHNHDFEFKDHEGTNGYELIMRETDASAVKLQIDLYWVMHSSKLSPAELFKQQPGRFVMWHIKDMDKVSRDYTELGNGSIDYTKILPEASVAGLQYYYLEQGGNFSKNSMQSIQDSADYFRKNLQQYL